MNEGKTIKLKRGRGEPSSLQEGEPAVDLLNKKLYVGGKNNEILKIESGIGKLTENNGEIFNNYEENIANKNAHAEGSMTEATGENSHAQNRKAKAHGKHSHAQNYNTLAQGEASSAEGVMSKAYQRGSHAEGYNTEAGSSEIGTSIDNPCHAEGHETSATGYAAHAEGKTTRAKAESSHTEGFDTEAQGVASHAEGNSTISEGENAHAEGLDTQAVGNNSHTEGQYTITEGISSHAEGSSTIAGDNYTHAEGNGTQAYKPASHAEGGSTIAGEAPEGVDANIVYPENEIDPKTYIPETGGNSGSGTESGEVAEKDWGSHAEGLGTRALAMASHAEGEMTKANKYASHAEGIGTIANTISQHVEGLYNIEDTRQKYLHIVGNGKNDKKRSNAHTIDWEGNAWFAGEITVGLNKKILATQESVNKRQFKDSIIIGNALMGATFETCDILYSDGDSFGKKFTEAYDMAINRGIKTIKILSGTYMSNERLYLNNEIKIVGENMPNIFFNHDENVIFGSFITIASSNVIIEGINFGNDSIEIYNEDYKNFYECIQIHNNIASGISGYAKKSFFTNNKVNFINITENGDITTDIITNNVISNNIISEKPQLLFDEDGNLIVTINGISKKFIPVME